MRSGVRIISTPETLTLSHSHPGLHSLYYVVKGKGLIYSDSLFDLKLRMKAMKVGAIRPEVVGAGETVVFAPNATSLGVLRCITPSLPVPKLRYDLSPRQWTRLWWDIFLKATEETYNHHGRGRVCVASSGGTDSTMALWALKEIGADVVSYSAGHSMDDFDPKWAKIIADHFGVPFHLVPIPTDDHGLQTLLRDTLEIVEQTSFSNVLMGMCCTELQRRALIDERPVVYTGYHADILCGNKFHVVGDFRKLPENQRTDIAWRDIRAHYTTGMIPNTHQLHQSFSRDGFIWRAVFGHPDIIDLALSIPRELMPDISGHKPFFENALNGLLPVGKRPWDEKVKVGFYTGAGIGTTRRQNPILSDANIQAVMRDIKSANGL